MRALLCTIPLLVGALAGCSAADPDAGRDAVLIDWLQTDNAIWRSRDPSLLAQKYQTMADDPYDFMRGTAGLFYADTARPGPDRISSDFATTHAARTVWLVGDAHPENLGTMLPGDTAGPVTGEPPPDLLLEWNDTDAATYGAYNLDLRRAALGLSVFVASIDDCDRGCRLDAVEDIGEAYSRGLVAAAAGFDPIAQVDGANGLRVYELLLDEALEEGAERKRLGKYTSLGEGGRTLTIDDQVDAAGEGMLAPTAADAARIDRIVAGIPKPAGFRVLDTARRFGQGVSSKAAFRYIVLFDTGSDGPEDDEMLNCREVVGAPDVPGATRSIEGLFDSDADRLEHARVIWSRPDADGRFGTTTVGNQSFKCQRWSSYHQGFDHDKLARAWTEGDISESDLDVMGELIGSMLAAAHARGRTLEGEPALDVILDDVAGRTSELGFEISNAALLDTERLLDDHARFTALLEEHGPWLGAEEL